MNQVPFASGRAADIFDLGDGTILRRYRTGRDSGPEARLMLWLLEAGFPVPRVHRSDGPDLVMDRVDGPTMLADLARHPWRLRSHARRLALLQRDLGAMSAPDWLHSAKGVPDGSSVLHLDLHPDNVILSANGPIVIDWTNSSRGPAGYDAAMTLVVLATSDVERWDQRIGRGVFVRVFSRWRGPILDEYVDRAAQARLDDRNVTGSERKAIHVLMHRRPTR